MRFEYYTIKEVTLYDNVLTLQHSRVAYNIDTRRSLWLSSINCI